MDILLFVFFRQSKVMFTFRLKNFFVLNFDKIVETDLDVGAWPSSCISQQDSVSPANFYIYQRGRHKINMALEMFFCFFNISDEILNHILGYTKGHIFCTIFSYKVLKIICPKTSLLQCWNWKLKNACSQISVKTSKRIPLVGPTLALGWELYFGVWLNVVQRNKFPTRTCYSWCYLSFPHL